MGEQDEAKRVKILEKEYIELKKSTFPTTMFYSISLIGGLFIFQIKKLLQSGTVTVLMSNIPGPTIFHMFGQKIDDVMGLGGIGNGDAGVGVLSFTYNGQLRFAVGAQKIVMTKEDADFFCQRVHKEFDILSKMPSCNTATKILEQV